MRILIVSATKGEIQPLLLAYRFAEREEGCLFAGILAGHEAEIVVTGVGMVPTAFSLSRIFALKSYDLAINAGICGSFNSQLQLGEVVHVASDFFPELGAESEDGFLSGKELNLLDRVQLMNEGLLVPEIPNGLEMPLKLKSVSGATVNTVHGNSGSIRNFNSRYKVEVESMEGAAFFYACQYSNIPCIQIRAVSNYVEPRNTSHWNIPLAIKNLNEFLMGYLSRLKN